MRIPDETLYAEGEKRLEDRKGFMLCTQCDKCPMNSENTVLPDGKWWCFYFAEWKRGDDLLEYQCEGYRMKSCASCERKKFCPNSGKVLYCKDYTRKGTFYKGRNYYGRRYAVRSTDPQVLHNENMFLQDKFRRIQDELN